MAVVHTIFHMQVHFFSNFKLFSQYFPHSQHHIYFYYVATSISGYNFYIFTSSPTHSRRKALLILSLYYQHSKLTVWKNKNQNVSKDMMNHVPTKVHIISLLDNVTLLSLHILLLELTILLLLLPIRLLELTILLLSLPIFLLELTILLQSLHISLQLLHILLQLLHILLQLLVILLQSLNIFLQSLHILLQLLNII